MPRKKAGSKWVEAGFVGVNSGCVVIMDPVDAVYEGGRAIQKWLDTETDGSNFHRLKWTFRNQFDKQVEIDGLISRTEYGDGLYRVWAKLDEHGRVRELRIPFDTAYGYDDESKEMHDISMAETMRKLIERDKTR